MEPWRDCGKVAADTHHDIEDQDPDPHWREKSDSDPHSRKKLDPDPQPFWKKARNAHDGYGKKKKQCCGALVQSRGAQIKLPP